MNLWAKNFIITTSISFFYAVLFIFGLGSFSLVNAKSRSPHNYSRKLRLLSCKQCHIKKPDPGSTEEEEIRNNLKAEYTKRCEKCHEHKIPQSCRLSSLKETTAILVNQISPFPLSLFQRQISCVSCHKIHQPPEGEKNPFILRKIYNLFRQASENINPHRSGIFCFLCHEKEPHGAEKEIYLKCKGDTVALCKNCHDNQRAKADNHPVNIIPSQSGGVKIPKDFPLFQGKVTCLTCHKLFCQGKKESPFFLRGGPYQKRIDTCLICHIKKQFLKVNPHDQLTDTGEIREDRCLFCHEINKENATGLAFKFKAPFKFYCLGCHPINIEEHPFGARHTGRKLHTVWGNLKPEERIELSQQEKFKMFPLTINGEIMCTTCHNPHDVRKGPKLRISDVNKSCQQCHYKKYGSLMKGEEATSQWMPKKKSGVSLPDQQTPSEKDLEPAREDKVSFGYRASLNYYCIGCHANKETNHPYGIRHTGKFIKRFWQSKFGSTESALGISTERQIFPLTLSGQVGCFTCHDPHNGAKGPKLRVESKKKLCILCHPNRSKVIEKYLQNSSQDPQ